MLSSIRINITCPRSTRIYAYAHTGTLIERFLARLIGLANMRLERIEAKFNDDTVVVCPGDSVWNILYNYELVSSKRAVPYPDLSTSYTVMTKNKLDTIDLFIEPKAQSRLEDVCREILAIANETGHTIQTKFNDTIITAEPSDDLIMIMEEYHRNKPQ